MLFQGPLLFKRPAPADAEHAVVPDYAVVQEEHEDDISSSNDSGHHYPEKTKGAEGTIDSAAAPTAVKGDDKEKRLILSEYNQTDYKKLLAEATERHHAKLRKQSGPLGWAMRTLHANPVGAGSIHETQNLIAVAKRIPAQIVVAVLYGAHYDIHTAQVGITGTPEGNRMERVYAHAAKYPNEVEHLYSFVQVITACTASFAHGANDVGNAVGVWAAMYAAWSTGEATGAKAPVPLWQIAVIAGTICIGFITYGYNIMKGKSIHSTSILQMLIIHSYG